MVPFPDKVALPRRSLSFDLCGYRR